MGSTKQNKVMGETEMKRQQGEIKTETVEIGLQGNERQNYLFICLFIYSFIHSFLKNF